MANLTFTELWAKAVDGVLDLGTIPSAVVDTCDMSTQLSLLNRTDYNISIVHELDGQYDELITTPSLAVEKPGLSLWTLMSSGFFHRVRLSATEDRQIYHVQICEATMAYQGNLS